MIEKAPSFVKSWCKRRGLDLDDFPHEWSCDPDVWEAATDEEIVGENKYSNSTEQVLRHVPTGRFVRVCGLSLPYGMDEYGDSLAAESEMEPQEIEEVFPVEVTETKYCTKSEMASRSKAEPGAAP